MSKGGTNSNGGQKVAMKLKWHKHGTSLQERACRSLPPLPPLPTVWYRTIETRVGELEMPGVVQQIPLEEPGCCLRGSPATPHCFSSNGFPGGRPRPAARGPSGEADDSVWVCFCASATFMLLKTHSSPTIELERQWRSHFILKCFLWKCQCCWQEATIVGLWEPSDSSS